MTDLRIVSLAAPFVSRAATTPATGYRIAIAFAIFSGVRQGELLGLRWQDLDLTAGVVSVRGQLDRERKIVPPKTEKGNREIPLPPFMVAALREWKLASHDSLPSDFVFCSETGGPLHYRNLVRRGLDKAADAAGINPPKPPKGEKPNSGSLPRVRWHDLRHTCASLLVSEGCDPVYVARVLGHASPGFTLSCYSHLFDAERHAESVSAALEATHGGIQI